MNKTITATSATTTTTTTTTRRACACPQDAWRWARLTGAAFDVYVDYLLLLLLGRLLASGSEEARSHTHARRHVRSSMRFEAPVRTRISHKINSLRFARLERCCCCCCCHCSTDTVAQGNEADRSTQRDTQRPVGRDRRASWRASEHLSACALRSAATGQRALDRLTSHCAHALTFRSQVTRDDHLRQTGERAGGWTDERTNGRLSRCSARECAATMADVGRKFTPMRLHEKEICDAEFLVIVAKHRPVEIIKLSDGWPNRLAQAKKRRSCRPAYTQTRARGAEKKRSQCQPVGRQTMRVALVAQYWRVRSSFHVRAPLTAGSRRAARHKAEGFNLVTAAAAAL